MSREQSIKNVKTKFKTASKKEIADAVLFHLKEYYPKISKLAESVEIFEKSNPLGI